MLSVLQKLRLPFKRNFSNSTPKHIEIEAKFTFSPDTENFIRAKSKYLGEKIFTDIYLDTNKYDLTCNDIWFRKRDKLFECKVPISSSSTNSLRIDRYQELNLENEIAEYLSSKISTLGHLSNEKNLQIFLEKARIEPFASITTTRRKYVYENITIDLDFTNFGYHLGEIEVVVDSESKLSDSTSIIEKVSKELKLETKTTLQGKVIQYIMMNRPEHYKALEKSGVLARNKK